MKYKRKEYPRPQFRRESWQSLNGEWEFDFGENCGILAGQLRLNRKTNVPFSYQWEASGIGDTAVHDTVWYRRKFKVNECDKRALLCFNAADYETDVWINGNHVIKHIGGVMPFFAGVKTFF